MAHAIRQQNPPQYRRIPAFRSQPMSGWDGVAAGLLAAGLALFSGCSGAAAQDRLQDRPSPVSACTGTTLARGTVSRVIDGRTFTLDDGRDIRLAAIEVPPLAPTDDAKAAPGGDAAKDALAGLLAGGDIELKQADAQTTDPLLTPRRLRLCQPRRQPRLRAGTADSGTGRPGRQAWPLGRFIL